jgi:serine/threonine protein kinase
MTMVGRNLAHYLVLERIGAGGMGVVYRARDTQLEREHLPAACPANYIGRISHQLPTDEHRAAKIAARSIRIECAPLTGIAADRFLRGRHPLCW